LLDNDDHNFANVVLGDDLQYDMRVLVLSVRISVVGALGTATIAMATSLLALVCLAITANK